MSVIKHCIESFAPFFSNVINLSLQCGIMPFREKQALIAPLLKQSTLDRSDLNNYRPISNLSILSKLIEHAVTQQLLSHFKRVPLPGCQSAYRPHHSTETALLDFISDVRRNMADGLSTVAISLDLSAAFDTVDHNILQQRLQRDFQIVDRCSEWFSRYLTDRYQSVTTDWHI